MSGWRAAIRVARREARRAKGRSLLVVAMIGTTVAPMTFLAVSYDMFELSPAEQADRAMGTAQAAITWEYDVPVRQDPRELFAFPGRPTSGTSGSEPNAGPAPDPTTDQLLAKLPAGTTVMTDQGGRLSVRTAAGVGTIGARMLDYADPLADGILRQLSGAAPAGAGEVALTPAAAERIGVDVGGTVRLADASRSFRVAGIVEDPTDLDSATIVLPDGALPPAEFDADRSQLTWLAATPDPVTWDQVKQLNTHGIAVLSRHVLENPPADEQLYTDGPTSDDVSWLALVAGVAVLEIVLLAGPAFAVGARRRRRELALVAATGGTPAHVRRIVLADGIVLGGLAAVAGIALGIAVAWFGRPFLESIDGSRAGGFRLFPEALAAIGALAVVTGLLAALVPAWISARQDVVTALAGRRGITRSPRRWLVLGLLLVAAGAAVAGAGAWQVDSRIIVGGLVIAELGLVLCTPSIVGLLGRLGRWLPLAPRIALRDTARNRAAAAPAISAVMAAVVGSIAVAVVVTAGDTRSERAHRVLGELGMISLFPNGPGKLGSSEAIPPEAVAALRATMPVEQVHHFSLPNCDGLRCTVQPLPPEADRCPYSLGRFGQDTDLSAEDQRAARADPRCDGVGDRYTYYAMLGSPVGMTVIAEAEAVGTLTGIAGDDLGPAAEALRRGEVVVSDPRLVVDGRVTLQISTAGPDRTESTRTVTAPAFAPTEQLAAPIVMMTEETAGTLDIDTMALGVVATTSRMPTTADEDRLQAALGDEFGFNIERGPDSNSPALLVLSVVAGVIALAAAAIATGLAATDGRADLATLAAVGASPRVRRVLSLSQSGMIAGLGSLLGAAAGLGASTAVLLALNQRYADIWPAPTPYPIAVPWLNVGIAVLLVPLVAMLGAGLLTRSRLPIERRL